MLRKYIFLGGTWNFVGCGSWSFSPKFFRTKIFQSAFGDSLDRLKMLQNACKYAQKIHFFGRNLEFYRVWVLVVFDKILQKEIFSKYFWRLSTSTPNGSKREKACSENTFFWAKLGIMSGVRLGRFRQNSSERKFFKVLLATV